MVCYFQGSESFFHFPSILVCNTSSYVLQEVLIFWSFREDKAFSPSCFGGTSEELI